jgi:O-antigen/teichoic acid export membrane protein
VFQALWGTIGQFLFAVNKQEKFAFVYVALAGLLAAAPALGPHSSAIERTAAISCFCEAAMFFVVYRAWRKEHAVDLASIRQAARWSVIRSKQAIQQLFLPRT